MTLTGLLWAIPVFGLIILVHELGHFAAAKAFGVRVHEFSIGFGPSFASTTRGETRYSLRLFLILGGFVRMAGMDESEADDPRGFGQKPVWQRMVIIGAGPLMNFILAALLFAVILGVVGTAERAVIGQVVPDSPAAQAGLQPDDRVLSVNGQPTAYWMDLVRLVRESGGQTLRLVVERGDSQVAVDVRPAAYPPGCADTAAGAQAAPACDWRLGVAAKHFPIGPVRAVVDGTRMTGLYTYQWFATMGEWIRQRVMPPVAGPIGIVSIIGEASVEGTLPLVFLAAQLSINIGIINLIPIPALDGARLLFLSFEGIRGRRVDPTRENLIHFLGFVLLLGLVLLITVFQDIPRLGS